MYRVCIILWDGAIIGVYTKEKIINTYPPLFSRLIARLRWAWIFYRQAMGYFDSPLYDHTYPENSYFPPDMIPKVQGV